MNRTLLKDITDWSQQHIRHCPEDNCKGMLLCSDDTYYLKCSDCGKYWIAKKIWLEISEDGELISDLE